MSNVRGLVLWVALGVVALTVGASGQPPSFTVTGLIAAPRRVDWTRAGATLQTRTTVCASLTTASTLAQINSAIAACTAGQVVSLAAGTYNLAGGLLFLNKNNITLRGAGPDQTFLVFSAEESCAGIGAYICVRSTDVMDIGGTPTVQTWSAGYARETSVITLGSVSGLTVGQVILLDQLDDSTTDTGTIWICDTANICCYDCASPSRGGNRAQSQAALVTAINGTAVSIAPPIMWPNFASGKTPQVAYPAGAGVAGIGIENLSISSNTDTAPAAGQSVTFYHASQSWMKNIRMTRCGNKCVRVYLSTNITVRDSYFYDKKGSDASQEGSESYGVDCYMCASLLVENNIFEHMTSPLMCESGVGNVYAYNYTRDDFYTVADPDWAQASAYNHGVCAYNLYEGNMGFGFNSDTIHGQNYFHTNFRNRYDGWESPRTLQTVAIHIYAANRYQNILGNVLGTDAYHTRYESFPPDGTNCDTSIFAIGWGGNCGGGAIADKATTRTTTMRWGNYDTVNDATRFQASEVPSGDATYPTPVPATQVLPASLYRPSRPGFFGSAAAWPAIGPDVTGGDVAGLGGHVNRIPAKICYDTGSFALGGTTFNAATCYPGGV